MKKNAIKLIKRYLPEVLLGYMVSHFRFKNHNQHHHNHNDGKYPIENSPIDFNSDPAPRMAPKIAAIPK